MHTVAFELKLAPQFRYLVAHAKFVENMFFVSVTFEVSHDPM